MVVEQLTEANEQLVLRAAKVSEAELEEIQQEAAGRLAAAERKVGGTWRAAHLLAYQGTISHVVVPALDLVDLQPSDMQVMLSCWKAVGTFCEQCR